MQSKRHLLGGALTNAEHMVGIRDALSMSATKVPRQEANPQNMVEVDDALSKSARNVFGKEATAQHMGGVCGTLLMGATKVPRQEANAQHTVGNTMLFRWVRQRCPYRFYV